MSASTTFVSARSFTCDAVAGAVIDDRGTIVSWTDEAVHLTGFAAEEVCGQPVRELLPDLHDSPRAGHGVDKWPAAGRVRVRHRGGGVVVVAFRVTRLAGSPEFLVLATPQPQAVDSEQGVSLLRTLFAQKRFRIALCDTDLTVVRTNAGPELPGDPQAVLGKRLRDTVPASEAEGVEEVLREVLRTGSPAVLENRPTEWLREPARQPLLSLTAFRLEDAAGRPTGVVVVFGDATEERRARLHLDVLRQAGARIGRSLDITRTAQSIADLLAPALGYLASVDLAQAVFDGEEPAKWLGGGDLHLRDAARAPIGAFDVGLEPGDALPPFPDHPKLRRLQRGETIIFDRDEFVAGLGDPQLAEHILPKDFRTLMVAPLHARGLLLGDITLWRGDRSGPFTEQETELVSEIASRGALAIDNARRYTREHRAALALQERLLPPATTDTPAAETAGVYLPAGGGAEIGGDWFDAIPLPSLRLALVVGDVVGHGMHATATMGRLRTAVQSLADLEPEPGELLAHIADLVQRLAAEAPPGHDDAVGATCLYAVYDPVARRCTLACAGHPPPIVVRPDLRAEPVAVSVGPPLAVGGVPYETATFDLEPGSVLALYTDGLIERDGEDVDRGVRRLTDALAASCRPDRPLNDTGRGLLAELGPPERRDDAALLLARTRVIPPEDTAHWTFPSDPAAVSDARAATTRQLAAWGLDHLAVTAELVVSELVTNAIRYGRPPVGLRLIRHNVLVYEVTDSSSTQPRLRRARTTDEGGRGLFLVAQLTTRWGCRYGQNGKTIWAEQSLESI
ncbi:SpoIIE family protein phosphatase [Streptomyces sp. NPDC058457]|uniref:ATP-binding SpoIIE family protein phosphatase n=1 Tax=Streptomyces sp. NPDC058457 TaxID=3346507 RepID=UPI00365560C5